MKKKTKSKKNSIYKFKELYKNKLKKKRRKPRKNNKKRKYSKKKKPKTLKGGTNPKQFMDVTGLPKDQPIVQELMRGDLGGTKAFKGTITSPTPSPLHEPENKLRTFLKKIFNEDLAIKYYNDIIRNGTLNWSKWRDLSGEFTKEELKFSKMIPEEDQMKIIEEANKQIKSSPAPEPVESSSLPPLSMSSQLTSREVLLRYQFTGTGRGGNFEYTATFYNNDDMVDALRSPTVFMRSIHDYGENTIILDERVDSRFLPKNEIMPKNFEKMQNFLEKRGFKCYIRKRS